MRVMGAGDGYKYLLRSVASADGERALSTPLTQYYAEQGTPPGRWMGGGLPALGQGEIQKERRSRRRSSNFCWGWGVTR